MNFLDYPRGRAGRFSAALILAVVFVAGFALGNHYAVTVAQGDTNPPPGADELFAPFWQVYNLIQDEYVDPEGDLVDNNALVDGAINGMVAVLEDQFSHYVDPASFPLVNDALSGQIEGIGVVIRTLAETNEVEVVDVLEGSPAQAAGIQAGDIFVAVGGEQVSEMDSADLTLAVRGPAGSQVEITMRRGEATIDFLVTRARITVPNVESRLLEDNIGYVRLNQFSATARADLDGAIEALRTQAPSAELSGLILDLRGNPGGLLTSAIDIGSAFLDEGVLLIEDFGDGDEKILEVTGSAVDTDTPLVVLVNEASASASELVAGALQDNGRATIIGQTTFGKGTVQTWRQLVNGGGIGMTVARWLTPNRSWIHANGITPDIVVELEAPVSEVRASGTEPADVQLDAAVEHLRSLVEAPVPASG